MIAHRIFREIACRDGERTFVHNKCYIFQNVNLTWQNSRIVKKHKVIRRLIAHPGYTNIISSYKEAEMSLRDTFFYVAGVGFLALAKAKNILQGYSSPKTFDISDITRCIEYDINVVEQWISHFQEYTQSSCTLEGKNVLELGPGTDLGIGIYLLSKGCWQYNACDVNDLMKSTPDDFYNQLFERLKEEDVQTNVDILKEQLLKAKTGCDSRLNYVVRDDFSIASSFRESTVDLVFSQAAFEHFEDIEETISQISAVCKPGAILVAQVDLKTHSRWIRDIDPNNIYRYPNWIYNIFWFRGIPNRVRPFQYKEALERFGWTDIRITPLKKLETSDKGFNCLYKNFCGAKNQMEYLSIMICAKKLQKR